MLPRDRKPARPSTMVTSWSTAKKVDIPSFIVKPGDIVGWREKSKGSGLFKAASDNVGRRRQATNWITVDSDNLTAAIDAEPAEDDIDTTIDTRMIVEYYSRR